MNIGKALKRSKSYHQTYTARRKIPLNEPRVLCTNCYGSGRYLGKPCFDCHGKGLVER